MDQSKTKGKQIWGKLKKFLIQKEDFIPFKNPKIDLFDRIQEGRIEKICLNTNVYAYLHQDEESIPFATFEQLSNINNLTVDNTGQLYWPAEEILAYFCLTNIEYFKTTTNIIELGAGKSGLASLSLALVSAKLPNLKQVIVTDGNETSSNSLSQNITLNQSQLMSVGFELNLGIKPNFTSNKSKVFCTGQCVWQKDYPNIKNELIGQVVILISDCLFFEKYHQELVTTLKFLLTTNEEIKENKCIIAAPSRGGSLDRFSSIAVENGLTVNREPFEDINYINKCQILSSNPSYVEDRHKIIFLIISL